VQQITGPFLGKRLGTKRINLLLARLTEALIAQGYITSRPYLVINIVPGKIEAFQVNGKTLRSQVPEEPPPGSPVNGGWFTDAGTLAAFPATAGDTLRLQDLEQGVDQINRLRRNKAELQILPGQTPGGSVIALTNQPGDRYRVNLGVDNYGSQATGTMRTRAGIDADNLIGMQEALSLGFVGSLETNAARKRGRSVRVSNVFLYRQLL
jgi:hemolysin activation/secretion protein